MSLFLGKAKSNTGMHPLTQQTDIQARYTRLALCMVLGLLILRLIGLSLSPLGLHGDEAQYWAWSKDLDWGYFTKPPLIAVTIAATTSIFGDAEWGVRLASPILHACTATLIFLTGRTAFDAKTGFWACTIYLLMPALWLSSSIISTDVPLLLCWVVALNGWINLRRVDISNKRAWAHALQIGLAIGIGMLAKYAMLFFVAALILTVLFDSPTRKALLSAKGIFIIALSALIISPNIAWNLQNDFATLSHTASNANMSDGPSFYPAELGKFLGDQLGVFGPISFILTLLAIIAAARGHLKAPALALSFFVLVPLIIISVQALASRANANWAVTAYIAASLLTAHFCVTYWPKLKAWLIGSLSVQTLICSSLALILLSPNLTDSFGLTNSVKRLRAWPQTINLLETSFEAGHAGRKYSHIAVDNRMTYYSLNYYGLGENAPLKMWMYAGGPHNQAELTAPLPALDGPVLLINYHADYEAKFREDFKRLEPLAPLDIDLGGGKRRVLKLWAGYGYIPTQTRN